MTELDEARLIEKLRAIEALHARPGSDGERVAAEGARERIVIALTSAAAFDRLGTRVPHAVWVALPSHVGSPRPDRLVGIFLERVALFP